MSWQRQVADVALELDDNGKLVYREVNLTVPRQSGKTTLLLAVLLERALGRPRQTIRYTAQTGADARKKWMDDWLPILEPSPFKRQFRVRLTNGHEALLFKNGSQQSLIATTKKTGHGGTIDLGILDEAFAHADARLEQALKPSMITRPQPQFWVVSTAGTPEDSPYLWGKVERGRELAARGLNHSVAYFEWAAADDMDPGDPETWRSCMPALGETQTEESVRGYFESMELNEFERAFLNRWKTALSDPVIPLSDWKDLTSQTQTRSH
jgi:phage terminase large subunit-like protein